MDIDEQSILFPNSKPKSLDNFDNPHTSIKEGINIENDNDLNKVMSALMT